MTNISSAHCPQCGAPAKSDTRNQCCIYCGADLVNESVSSSTETNPILSTTFLKVKVSEKDYINRMKNALSNDVQVYVEYIDLVTETERSLMYIPIVYYKYHYYNCDWNGEVSIKQVSGKTITFPQSGRMRGTIVLPVINAKSSELPIRASHILNLFALKYNSIEDAESDQRDTQITFISGAYSPESLLKKYDNTIKNAVLKDVESSISGSVRKIHLVWNHFYECKIIYNPFWITTGKLKDSDNYFFILNANTAELSYHTDRVGSYPRGPTYKTYRKMSIILAIVSLFLPGENSVWFFLLLAGLSLPKLLPRIYPMLNKKLTCTRTFKSAENIAEFENIYRRLLVPLIYVGTVVGFLLSAYFAFT